MISGNLKILLALALAPAALVATALVPNALGAGLEPDALIGRLAKPAPASIAFTEIRFSSLLREPLVVSGELGYLDPESLDRHVREPYREDTQIRAGSVRVERESQAPRKFALKRAPELQGLLAGFSALLSGDAEAVKRSFSLAVTGDEQGWQLELTPLDTRVRRSLQRIIIDGTADRPRCFTTINTNEGASIMLLGKTAELQLPDELTREQLRRMCTPDAHN